MGPPPALQRLPSEATHWDATLMGFPLGMLDWADEEMFAALVRRGVPFLVFDVMQPTQPIVFVTDELLALTGTTRSDACSCPLPGLLRRLGVRARHVQMLLAAVRAGDAVPAVPVTAADGCCARWGLRPICALKPESVTHYVFAPQTDSTAVYFTPVAAHPKSPSPPAPPIVSPPRHALSPRPQPRSRPLPLSPIAGGSPAGPVTLSVSPNLTILACLGPAMALLGRPPAELEGAAFPSLLAGPDPDGDVWTWGSQTRVIVVATPGGAATPMAATVGAPQRCGGQAALAVAISAIDAEALAGPHRTPPALLRSAALTSPPPTPPPPPGECVAREVRQHLTVLRLGLHHLREQQPSQLGQTCPPQRGVPATLADLERALTAAEGALGDSGLAGGAARCRPTPAAGLLGPALAAVADLCPQGKVRLTHHVAKVLDNVVAELDVEKWHRVVTLLLADAVRGTAAGGGVHVDLGQSSSGGHGAPALKLTVRSNDGVSLGTTGTAHVLDSRQTNSELVVARHLVEAHGGTLVLKPLAGAGLEYEVALPLTPPAGPGERPAAHSPPGRTPSSPMPIKVPTPPRGSCPASSSIGRLRSMSLDTFPGPVDILVVDDQPLVRKYLRAVLTPQQYSVATACSAEEVLERYSSGERWRLIISDFVMDGMSGPELAVELLQRGCTVPIIGITANSTEEDVCHFLRAGARAVYQKPLPLPAVLACVAKHLRPTAPEA